MAQDPKDNDAQNRRKFLTASIALGAAAALTACEDKAKTGTAGSATPAAGGSAKPSAAGEGHLESEVKPGQLDEYYGFWSGGQSGEIRILGVPSMRELKRIPVFNRDSATGWGRSDWSKQLLKGLESGDTHHVHLSYKDGTYDGRYVYVNDKSNARLARVDIETMEVDAITDIPNSQGTHGIFPQRHKTGLVFCNSEFRTPLPDDGKGELEDTKTYAAMHTAIDGETMEVKWQVMVDGNMDLAAADYKGLYSFATCYNSEKASDLEGMMAKDQDHLWVFNLAEIEKAVKEGKGIKVGDSNVPVIDARGDNGPYVQRIPVPKSPHGVNMDPTGKYAVVSGKLSPTASVIDVDKLADVFAGKIKPREAVVAEPEVGLGPLHTAFDGRGNAYTSIFIDSVITKWNIDKAIKAFKGEKVDPIIQKLDVHYQVGHTNASMSETKEADGKWLVALCKFSKDRFLNVGPAAPGKRPAHRHQRRKDAPGPRRADLLGAARLRHRQARPDPPAEDPAAQGAALQDVRGVGQGRRRRPQEGQQGHPQGQERARLHDEHGAQVRHQDVQGEEGRYRPGHLDESGQRGGPIPRVLHDSARRDHGGELPGHEQHHLHGRQARCVLVLLPVVLPRIAPGNARSHDRGGLKHSEARGG